MYVHNVPYVFSNYNPLVNFIESLLDDGYQDIESIPEISKNETIALIMDALGDDQSYVIFDTDDFNDHCNHIKNFLRTSNSNEINSFYKKIRLSAFDKYKDYLDLIMDELNRQRRAA